MVPVVPPVVVPVEPPVPPPVVPVVLVVPPPVVAVVGAKGLSVAEAAAAVEVARKELIAEKCALLAIMVNRADPEDLADIAAAVKPGASGRPVYVLPELDEIARPTTGERPVRRPAARPAPERAGRRPAAPRR